MTIATQIADALVEALDGAGLTGAERRPVPYLEREQAADRKIVVIVRNQQYSDGHRSDYDTIVELSIVVQKAIDDPQDNGPIDTLLADVAYIAALFGESGALRHSTLAGAIFDDGPEHPTGNLYEAQHLLELNLFTSVTVVRYRVLA